MAAIQVLSSMATRRVLAERVEAFDGPAVLTAIGGVDAVRRVRAGEPFDVVVLAADALDKLQAEGHLAELPRLDWVDSDVAVAVSAGEALPSITDETALRGAVLVADRVGVSTGPSGVALTSLFARWGVDPARVVVAPAGVPVASLLARREIALGFQQTSELIGCDGIVVVGPLPSSIQVTTTFSAAVAATAREHAAAQAFLRWLADPSAADAIRRHGMTPHFEEAAR